MLDLPSIVKIGGHEYKLLVPYAFKERSDLNGQCDNNYLELRISTSEFNGDRADSTVKVTILHELIHAVDFTSGLNVLCGGSDERERIVEMLSHGLYQVFKDNPKLLGLFE